MSEQGIVKGLMVVDPTRTGEAPVSREEVSNKAVMNMFRYLASGHRKEVEGFIDFLDP